MKTKLLYPFLFILFLLNSCQSEDKKSSEKDILTFSITNQVGESTIDTGNENISAIVEKGTDLSAIIPVFTISERASSNPESGSSVDFSGGTVTFVVTAEDRSTKNWKVSVDTVLLSEAQILTFYVEGQLADFVIGDSTITGEINKKYDLTKVSPVITISSGAKVNPASGIETDFSGSAVVYSVTAEDGTQKNYNVTISKDPNNEALIKSITIDDMVGDPTLYASTYTVHMPFASDLSNLAPVFTLSIGATIAPESGVAQNFSNDTTIKYIVLAEDGKTDRVWNVAADYAVYAANNPYIQYMGRVSFADSLKPKIWAPGAMVRFKFKGPYCEVVLNDEALYGSNYNYLEIIVDGEEPKRIHTTGKSNNLVFSGLSNTEHTVSIIKDTESGMGYIEFCGVRTAELLGPDILPTRKIEYIGNSITCGASAYIDSLDCDAEATWFDRHMAYNSYGPKTSRALNAQWQLTSLSGVGLMHSCCDMTVIMPQIFDKVCFYNNSIAWNFDRYIPDVVTICLGQNDGQQDSATFCANYVTFIKKVRGYYPNAYIVCLTSPMADEPLRNYMKNALTSVVQTMNNEGDTKVSKFFFSQGWNGGCGSHPSIAEHTVIAEELTAYLKTLTGW